MQTITLTRQDSEERIQALALALGYKTEIQDGEKEERVIDDDGNDVGSQLVPNMIANTENALEFVSKYFQNKIDTEIFEVFKKVKEQEIEVRVAEEKRLLEEQLKADIGTTNIE